MSGGVRNLRAMFENKDTTSPPDRGRSPGESTGAPSSATSPRPLSKVRTNFVTVERSGNQLGLKRDTSGEPSMTKRRTSFSIDERDHPKETAERKESIATEMEARKQSTVIKETIPETAVETPPLETEEKPKPSVESNEKRERIPEPRKTESKKAPPATNGHTNGSLKPAAAAEATEKVTTSKTATKPAPISTARTNTAPKPSPSPKKLKSPLPKTPTTPKRAQPKETTAVPEKKSEKKPVEVPEKKAEKKPERKPSRTTLQPSQTTKPASKPPTTAAHGSIPKTRIPASPPQTGFHKPRPKSPTRPVKLPASLTAHTASSGSKTATAAPLAGRQSLSRASGNVQPPNNLTRSSSRASSVAPKPVARSTSTLKTGGTRPSLGPPPATLKKQSSRQSLPPAPADDSFLARMMRPTTASASKTAEKPPTTPPKQTSVKRPAPKDGTPKQEPVKVASAIQKKEASPAKTVQKQAKPVTKTEPKVSSPTKSVETEKVPVFEQKDVAPEVSTTPAGPLAAAVEPSTTETSEVNVKPTEAEAQKAEEAIEGETPAAPEVEQEEIAAEAQASIERPNTPAKAEAVVESEKDQSPIIDSPAATKEPVPAIETVVPAKDTPVEPEAIPAPPSEPKPAVTEPLESPKEIPAEDPEDVKAREEIAKLNAELLKGIEETA